MYHVKKVRDDFPILSKLVNGKPLVYLDNAASAQKPQVVIDAIVTAYTEEYANVHRGLHYLSNLATDKFEAVRGKIKEFINAEHDDEIIYTTGSTEGINMVAFGWGMPNLKADDEIVLSVLEHHANIIPWHFLRERQGIRLIWVEPEDDGSLDTQKVADAISPKTRLVAISHLSNVTGCRVDIRGISEIAHKNGVVVLVDGSQSCVHMPIDVQQLGCDFFAITGHKLYGPSASGALYACRSRLKEMQPFKGGGNMIHEVGRETITYGAPPTMFEAGTPAIVEMIGLGVAVDYLQDLGMVNIERHEEEIVAYASRQFANEPWIQLQGAAQKNAAIFSFTLDCPAHPHDISTILDQQGIAIRAGHHCAQPLMSFLGVSATCRASFGLYNTKEEVDTLIEGLRVCRDLFS